MWLLYKGWGIKKIYKARIPKYFLISKHLVSLVEINSCRFFSRFLRNENYIKAKKITSFSEMRTRYQAGEPFYGQNGQVFHKEEDVDRSTTTRWATIKNKCNFM